MANRETMDALTAEQRDAIQQAVCDPSLHHPPINIRLSLPAFGRRKFLTIIGGAERRGARRRPRNGRNFHCVPPPTSCFSFSWAG